jgi:hypothetical protein
MEFLTVDVMVPSSPPLRNKESIASALVHPIQLVVYR